MTETGDPLFIGARAGEAASVSGLLVRCQPRLLARIRVMLGERGQRLAESEDVLQQLAAKILEDREHLLVRDEAHFLNLATRIARHLLIDQVRRPRVQRFDSLASNFEPGADSGVDTPSQGAAKDETVLRVLEALEGLTDDHRRVIELRYLEGLSFAEIGAQLDRSENAVQLLHARALPRLRRLLAQ